MNAIPQSPGYRTFGYIQHRCNFNNRKIAIKQKLQLRPGDEISWMANTAGTGPSSNIAWASWNKKQLWYDSMLINNIN